MPLFVQDSLFLNKTLFVSFIFSLIALFPLHVIAQNTSSEIVPELAPETIPEIAQAKVAVAETTTPKVQTAEVPIPEITRKERSFSLSEESIDKLLKTMVWVEAGSFIMGSDATEARNRERPAHEVSLDGYFIAKYELTQDIFEELMGWNNSYFACATCPLNNISWFNMQLFIKRLNNVTGKHFRLPTEAEWAYAAKGGVKSKNYTFSGSNNIADVAWFDKNSKKRSHPVGLKKPNELGLYDMTGNLWEFCQDDMSRNTYKHTKKHNPFYGDKKNQQKKAMKVLRGSGYEFSAAESMVYIRDGATNNVRMPDIGFRLAMDKE